MTWEAPRKSRVYQIDDSPKFHSEGWGERVYRSRGLRAWVALGVVFGIAVMFWMAVAKGF